VRDGAFLVVSQNTPSVDSQSLQKKKGVNHGAKRICHIGNLLIEIWLGYADRNVDSFQRAAI
jgi:chromosome condensin MukBEF complex kleisin-like MukF subunit